MTISYHGENKFRIKTKNNKISTGSKIAINDVEIDGPGEFEVSGVECRAAQDSIFVFYAEGIRLAYFRRDAREPSEKELEDLGEIDILLIPADEPALATRLGGGQPADRQEKKQWQSKKIIAYLEPKITFPYSIHNLDKFCRENNCQKTDAVFKVKNSDLGEENKIIALIPKN